jgi:hypothetical protein
MRRFVDTAALLLGMLISTSCVTVTTRFVPSGPARTSAPRSAEDVEVFVNLVPDRRVHVVGYVEADLSSNFKTAHMNDCIAALKGEAAAHGADALIAVNYCRGTAVRWDERGERLAPPEGSRVPLKKAAAR